MIFVVDVRVGAGGGFVLFACTRRAILAGRLSGGSGIRSGAGCWRGVVAVAVANHRAVERLLVQVVPLLGLTAFVSLMDVGGDAAFDFGGNASGQTFLLLEARIRAIQFCRVEFL